MVTLRPLFEDLVAHAVAAMDRRQATRAAAVAIVCTTTAAVTAYYVLAISQRRKGRALVTPTELWAHTEPSWIAWVWRQFRNQNIHAVAVVNQEGVLTAFPPNLAGLGGLTELTLSGNGLLELPPSIGLLRKLRKLNMSRNKLTSIPGEIGALVLLEDLDLGRNQLESVSPRLGDLKRLKYLNLMANQLASLPDEIGGLPALYRLGLKSNRLRCLPASIGGLSSLVELFITDNELEELPPCLGSCTSLVKLQASFNKLRRLPAEMGALPRLELMRVAVNRLEELPPSFERLDSLAWLSVAGNPMCPPPPPAHAGVEPVSFEHLDLGEPLGDGASGDVFAGKLGLCDMAFKRFKAETSPDGHSADEMAVACALEHPHLVRTFGLVQQPQGLVMERLFGTAMADKPNFESLLRCRWAKGASFTEEYVLRVASCIGSALDHMHSVGICHGDVYAHNVVAELDGNAVLCDYGASFCYEPSSPIPYEAHEVRAFGLFLGDLVARMESSPAAPSQETKRSLEALVGACTGGAALDRLSFEDVVGELSSISEQRTHTL